MAPGFGWPRLGACLTVLLAVSLGAAADVVVFDPDRIRAPATFTEPHQLAEGVVHVFVNGEETMRDGRFTGARLGRALRSEGSLYRAPGR